MIYLPDTNVLSRFMRAQHVMLITRVLAAAAQEQLRLSAIVLAELEFGAEKAFLQGNKRPRERVAMLRKSIPLESFPDEAVVCYAKIRAELEIQGNPIGTMDTLIAAHALALGATLVTANEREFRRVSKLKVENWEK